MKKIVISAIVLAISAVAYAAGITCPLHTYASCIDTYETSPTGSGAHKFHCTCGDDVWVKTR